MQALRSLIASVRKVAEVDLSVNTNEGLAEVATAVDALEAQLASFGQKPAADPAETPAELASAPLDESGTLYGHIASLRVAAEKPLKNYQRVVALCASLDKIARIAARPQYAAARPMIATCVTKLAGIFAQVDSVEDLDKPLEAIESAVHSLYKNPNDPSTYNFSAKNKGPYKAG